MEFVNEFLFPGKYFFIVCVFRSLPLAFRGLAPKPPQSLRSLRGLGRLADPLESSGCFYKHLEISLFVSCHISLYFLRI